MNNVQRKCLNNFISCLFVCNVNFANMKGCGRPHHQYVLEMMHKGSLPSFTSFYHCWLPIDFRHSPLTGVVGKFSVSPTGTSSSSVLWCALWDIITPLSIPYFSKWLLWGKLLFTQPSLCWASRVFGTVTGFRSVSCCNISQPCLSPWTHCHEVW